MMDFSSERLCALLYEDKTGKRLVIEVRLSLLTAEEYWGRRHGELRMAEAARERRTRSSR